MRACHLVFAAIVIALAGPAATLAQSDPASKAKPEAPSLAKDELTELSGLTVTAKRPDPTPISGVTVAARRSARVSELTVTAPKCPPPKDPVDPDATPPKLLSSYPAAGSTIRPGIVILRLTFDRPMTCTGLLNKHSDFPNPCPAPLNNPLFSRDRRTFLTICILDEGPPGSTQTVGTAYGLRLDNFTSLSGRPLKPSDLTFYVNPHSVGVRTVKEAMAQDRFLRDAQKAAEQAP